MPIKTKNTKLGQKTYFRRSSLLDTRIHVNRKFFGSIIFLLTGFLLHKKGEHNLVRCNKKSMKLSWFGLLVLIVVFCLSCIIVIDRSHMILMLKAPWKLYLKKYDELKKVHPHYKVYLTQAQVIMCQHCSGKFI